MTDLPDAARYPRDITRLRKLIADYDSEIALWPPGEILDDLVEERARLAAALSRRETFSHDRQSR